MRSLCFSTHQGTLTGLCFSMETRCPLNIAVIKYIALDDSLGHFLGQDSLCSYATEGKWGEAVGEGVCGRGCVGGGGEMSGKRAQVTCVYIHTSSISM